MIYLIFGLLAILKIFAESTEVMELKMTAEKFIENHPSFTTGEFADSSERSAGNRKIHHLQHSEEEM